jgi:glyceraldehyde 3-phosphate dehydrogenase
MSRPVRVAINGFGRIGRSFFKTAYNHPDIEIVCVNDLADIKTLSHLLKYDSVHGIFQPELKVENDYLQIDNTKTFFTSIASIEDLNWDKYDVDIVIESTGKYKTKKTLQHHNKNGAKKVILSAPSVDDDIKMLILGVNDDKFDFTQPIISLASCTTNNSAPMLHILHQALGVKKAYITTVHSYTSDQSLHDQPHRDLRRARAATQSIVPTTTGAAKALTKVFPDLSEVIGGCGIRVPVPNGSLTDMTIVTKKNTTEEEVNHLFLDYIRDQKFRNIVKYLDVPLVSKDIIGSPYSCLYDVEMTSVIGGDLIKLIGWYDNEIGYSNRLLDTLTQTSFPAS